MNTLPKIIYKGKTYIFDYRLQELREVKTIRSVFLNAQEVELLAYAIEKNDSELIKINMEDLRYKLK